MGANGVLIQRVATRPSATIGIGLGSSQVEYGRHSAYGYGTSVGYAAPLGENRVLEGSAIYVR